MITVISYPNLNLNYSVEVPSSSDSGKMVRNIFINVSDAGDDEFIEISYNSEVVTLLITDECRYTPIDVAFQNKEGSVVILPFFKAKTESIEVSKETFESHRGQPSEGNHQFIDFNVNSKTSFRINSGFVTEEMNDVFKQLMLSERVWILDNDNYIPINVKGSSLEYKTRQKDRLINYEIEFVYSYFEINNI